MTTTRTKTDKLDELHQRLTAQVETLISGEDWKAMLAVASRFYRYSARNIMLIQAQFPSATRVGGYRFWPTVGRFVRKGESGIAILTPCLYRAAKTDVAGGDDATEAKRVLRGFRVAHVFDVSQTDGEPLADVRPQLLVGDDTAQLWAGVGAQVTAAGYSLERGDCDGANGVTDFLARTVRVRADVDDLQAAKSLTHELAHCLLHDPTQAAIARPRAEVEAESVAYVVCQAAGMATTSYSLPYLARWSGGDPALITATADRVLATARTILDGLGLGPSETGEHSG